MGILQYILHGFFVDTTFNSPLLVFFRDVVKSFMSYFYLTVCDPSLSAYPNFFGGFEQYQIVSLIFVLFLPFFVKFIDRVLYALGGLS